MANSVDQDQTALIGAVCSGSTLFASILNSSVMLGKYLQQTTFSDEFFSWRFRVEQSLLCSHSKGFVFGGSVFGSCFVIRYFVSV